MAPVADAVELLGAGVALLATLSAGVVVHELSHAVTLRAFGIAGDIEWLPDDGSGGPLGVGPRGSLATVTPRAVPPDVPAWGLRLAAVMPLAMTLPLVLAMIGVLPDPFGGDGLVGPAVTIGWLACALPSPRDFSLFWYAGRALEDDRDSRDR